VREKLRWKFTSELRHELFLFRRHHFPTIAAAAAAKVVKGKFAVA